jgi:hypothetical protein
MGLMGKQQDGSTEPWGTPESTLTASDEAPSSTTVCLQTVLDPSCCFPINPIVSQFMY